MCCMCCMCMCVHSSYIQGVFFCLFFFSTRMAKFSMRGQCFRAPICFEPKSGFPRRPASRLCMLKKDQHRSMHTLLEESGTVLCARVFGACVCERVCEAAVPPSNHGNKARHGPRTVKVSVRWPSMCFVALFSTEVSLFRIFLAAFRIAHRPHLHPPPPTPGPPLDPGCPALLPHVHRAWRPLMASLREHLTPLPPAVPAGEGGQDPGGLHSREQCV